MPRQNKDYRDLYYSLFNDVTTQIRRLEQLREDTQGSSLEAIDDVMHGLMMAQRKTEDMFIEDFCPDAELTVLNAERGEKHG